MEVADSILIFKFYFQVQLDFICQQEDLLSSPITEVHIARKKMIGFDSSDLIYPDKMNRIWKLKLG